VNVIIINYVQSECLYKFSDVHLYGKSLSLRAHIVVDCEA
jgi:hypothetical protein